ncbi:hypothetical protein [Xanthobacter sp. VNH20]|uniref:hypothetical protein n=1 Tax=Xanthobacter sp. VNH20 TaxID=3156616 RepID=UPI0032B406B2
MNTFCASALNGDLDCIGRHASPKPLSRADQVHRRLDRWGSNTQAQFSIQIEAKATPQHELLDKTTVL